MTRIGVLLLAALLLSACTSPERIAERESEIEEQVHRIPITVANTSAEDRAAMRRDGRPVMLVKATPAPLYRDYQQLKGEIRRYADTTIHEVPDVQGCVVVAYDVRPDGKTDGFEIEKSDPAGVFDKAALRAALATEYEPAAAPGARQRRALWFLVARPPRAAFSKLNDVVEEERNKRREEQRAACEGSAA